MLINESSIKESHALSSEIDIPCNNGLEYRGFQKAAVAFASTRKSVLIADSPGVGKTIEALAILNYNKLWRRVLIVSPASLKINWQRESEKWLVEPCPITLIEGKIKNIPDEGIFILNYDILKKHHDLTYAWMWDYIICDESHNLSNPEAIRTREVVGDGTNPGILAEYKIFLTGTPMRNRPVEMWPSLHYLDPETFPDFMKYARRYCNPPEAPIWMGDLSFKPLGEVKVGDEVIGWEKGQPGGRSKQGQGRYKLIRTTVTHINRRQAPLVRVTFASGRSLRCTPDHLWLNANTASCNEYAYCEPKVSRKLVHIIDPTPELDSSKTWVAGYLAGIMDGEGTWPRITQSREKNAAVCECITASLDVLNIPYSNGEEHHYIRGGRQSAVNFLNWCKPVKREWIEKRIFTGRFRTPDQIVSVEPDGFGEVISMTTTTGNYVAWGYASKNCDPKLKDVTRWDARRKMYVRRRAWDFSGAANLKELNALLRSNVMIRRLKSEVLKELPPKSHQIIELPNNSSSSDIIKREQRAWTDYQNTLERLQTAVELAKTSNNPDEYGQAVDRLKKEAKVGFNAIAAVRKETAIAKLPYVTEQIRGLVEQDKIIVFAHHIEVLKAIYKEFESIAVLVYGDTSKEKRQEAVDRFQTDPSCRLFVGGIIPAGTGLTLTAASFVIFAEIDWVPANMLQAEDRANRIGSEYPLLVQHMVLESSLDAKMIRTLVAKQKIIEEALDRGEMPDTKPLLGLTPPSTYTLTREQIDEQVKGLNKQLIPVILKGLKVVASYCDGATKADAKGFNRIDASIGKSLASQNSLSVRQAVLGKHLLSRYQQQLPAEINKLLFKESS